MQKTYLCIDLKTFYASVECVERKLELVINRIKSEMGKNKILRGMDLQEGATTLVRNTLIGGHNSGE